MTYLLVNSDTGHSIPWERFPQTYKRHWDLGDAGPAAYSDRSSAQVAARIYDAQMGHRKGRTQLKEMNLD